MPGTDGWKSVLKADPTAWLLEEENPSVRFWTLKDIVGRDENSLELVQARERIASASEVERVFAKSGVNGGPFWSTPDSSICYEPGNSSTIFCLSLLAEFGLTYEHSLIKQACDFLFRYQTDEGGFKTGTERWSCLTGMILQLLIRFGLSRDERVMKIRRWLHDTQRLDGGWYCTEDALIGGSQEKLESCPWAVLNILAAFAELPELRTSKEAVPAIEFLLRHWVVKKPIPDRPHGRYGIGRRWQQIRFPFFNYDLLNYAAVLSRYDYALKDPRFKEVVALLLDKQDENGRWKIESPHPGWEEFEFGREGSASKWATLNALRVIKRFYSRQR